MNTVNFADLPKEETDPIQDREDDLIRQNHLAKIQRLKEMHEREEEIEKKARLKAMK